MISGKVKVKVLAKGKVKQRTSKCTITVQNSFNLQCLELHSKGILKESKVQWGVRLSSIGTNSITNI